jgi:hypothetical protein
MALLVCDKQKVAAAGKFRRRLLILLVRIKRAKKRALTE